MPMPLFPYAKGSFFKTADEALNTPARLAKAQENLASNRSTLTLAEDRKNATGSEPQLNAGSYDHFAAHWHEDDGVGTPSFPKIPKARMDAVLKEGYRRAVETAYQNKVDGEPLPVSSVWICASDDETFDVVTVLNKGINVQAIIVTPPPVHLTSDHATKEDAVQVTRHFASKSQVGDVEYRLTRMKSNKTPLVQDSDGNDIGNPGENGKVGTFVLFT